MENGAQNGDALNPWASALHKSILDNNLDCYPVQKRGADGDTILDANIRGARYYKEIALLTLPPLDQLRSLGLEGMLRACY
jgi:hypothetical protein